MLEIVDLRTRIAATRSGHGSEPKIIEVSKSMKIIISDVRGIVDTVTFKIPLWDGTGTEMRTQYQPTH